jgi:peptidoglycan/LPS O-acetylase OafA/YrhL
MHPVPLGMKQLFARPVRKEAGNADRLDFLDTLRGLAAIYVVCFHVVYMPEPNLPAPVWLLPAIEAGATGVALFFVLSVFSLCYTMPRHEATSSPLTSFYIHRIFRILPLLYFWLLVMVSRDWLRPDHRYSLPELGANVLVLFNFFPKWQGGIVTASWTIGVEMVFYAIFPFAWYALRRRAWRWLAILLLGAGCWFGATAMAFGLSWMGAPMGFFYHLPVFVIGFGTYFVWQTFFRTRKPGHHRAIGQVMCALGLAIGFSTTYGMLPAVLASRGWYDLAVSYSLILLGLSLWSPAFVVNRVTSLLGVMSFSIYLAHPIVISRMHGVYERVYASGVGGGAALGASIVATLMVLLPLSWLTYRLIELPGMRLGKLLVNRWSRPAVSEADVGVRSGT